jgi:hypothetical protein
VTQRRVASSIALQENPSPDLDELMERAIRNPDPNLRRILERVEGRRLAEQGSYFEDDPERMVDAPCRPGVIRLPSGTRIVRECPPARRTPPVQPVDPDVTPPPEPAQETAPTQETAPAEATAPAQETAREPPRGVASGWVTLYPVPDLDTNLDNLSFELSQVRRLAGIAPEAFRPALEASPTVQSIFEYLQGLGPQELRPPIRMQLRITLRIGEAGTEVVAVEELCTEVRGDRSRLIRGDCSP